MGDLEILSCKWNLIGECFFDIFDGVNLGRDEASGFYETLFDERLPFLGKLLNSLFEIDWFNNVEHVDTLFKILRRLVCFESPLGNDEFV
jgi:hypothetical protein